MGWGFKNDGGCGSPFKKVGDRDAKALRDLLNAFNADLVLSALVALHLLVRYFEDFGKALLRHADALPEKLHLFANCLAAEYFVSSHGRNYSNLGIGQIPPNAGKKSAVTTALYACSIDTYFIPFQEVSCKVR